MYLILYFTFFTSYLVKRQGQNLPRDQLKREFAVLTPNLNCPKNTIVMFFWWLWGQEKNYLESPWKVLRLWKYCKFSCFFMVHPYFVKEIDFLLISTLIYGTNSLCVILSFQGFTIEKTFFFTSKCHDEKSLSAPMSFPINN